MKKLRERLEWYDLGQKIFPWWLLILAIVGITLLYFMPSILFGASDRNEKIDAEQVCFELTDDREIALKSLEGEVIATYDRSTEPMGGNELFQPKYTGRAPTAASRDYDALYAYVDNWAVAHPEEFGHSGGLSSPDIVKAVMLITDTDGVYTWFDKDGAIASAMIFDGEVVVAFYDDLPSSSAVQQAD